MNKIKEKKWSSAEGELAIDLYQNEKEIVVRAAVAAVKAEEIKISFEGDLLIIKGERKRPEEGANTNYFIEECYWGKFSRKIIIPDEIDPSRISASIKDGVLIIKIPRIIREVKGTIKIKEER